MWYRHTGQAELPEGVDWTTLHEPTLQTREEVLKETHKQSVTHIKTAMTIPQFLTEWAPEVRHLQYMSNGKYDTTAIANLINRYGYTVILLRALINSLLKQRSGSDAQLFSL